MCLNSVKNYTGPAVRIGYKVVTRDGRCPFVTSAKALKQGTNIANTLRNIIADDGTVYRSGFHCFLTRKTAERFKDHCFGESHRIIRVICSGITYRGKDFIQTEMGKKYLTTIVCSTIEISEKVWKELPHVS